MSQRLSFHNWINYEPSTTTYRINRLSSWHSLHLYPSRGLETRRLNPQLSLDIDIKTFPSYMKAPRTDISPALCPSRHTEFTSSQGSMSGVTSLFFWAPVSFGVGHARLLLVCLGGLRPNAPQVLERRANSCWVKCALSARSCPLPMLSASALSRR